MPLLNTLSLPYGLTARALTMDDAGAVFEMAALQEQHDLGKVEIEAADIVADWQRPSFDVGSQTIGVFEGETMVGYGEITGIRAPFAVRQDSVLNDSPDLGSVP